MVVTSASDLSDESRKNLINTLSDLFKKGIIFSSVIDSSLLGGVVVRVGSKMLDTTIKNKLLRIKKLAL